MGLHEFVLDSRQRLLHGRNLRNNIDAIAIILEHELEPPQLTLNNF